MADRVQGGVRVLSRHALVVTARAGAATTLVAGATLAVAPGFVTPATIVAAVMVIAFELTRVHVTVGRRLDEIEADLAQVQPLLQLERLIEPRRPLQPMRGFAIAPDFGVMLAQLVADRRPELVVETGSGVSTVIIAYALEKLGRGRVIALEHDPEYAQRTREELRRHGLEAFATVVEAPLEPVTIDGATYEWYSLRALDGIRGIDLVVDDGPPRYVGHMLRYASLPLLSRRMNASGLFVLDVVGEEERTILDRWRRELPAFHQDRVATKKGNVLIWRAA